MSDMFWLQHFVDKRIAAAHKETAAAPNTAHGSVVVDRFGHVVSGMPGASGGGSLWAIRFKISHSPGQTFTAGVQDIINFDSPSITAYGDEDFPVANGAPGDPDWTLTSMVAAYYHVTVAVGLDTLTPTSAGLAFMNLTCTGGLDNYAPTGGFGGVLDIADASQPKYILSGSDDIGLTAGGTMAVKLYLSADATIKSGYIAIHRIGVAT